MPHGSIREGRHRYALRVYYEDTDAGGIVYHANYLRFAERARTEALRDLGVPHAEMVRDWRLMFVVRRAKLDYFRPARLDDSLEVVTEPVELRAAVVQAAPGHTRPARVVRGGRNRASVRHARRHEAGPHPAALAGRVRGDAGGPAAG